jgi:hypothetical protein
VQAACPPAFFNSDACDSYLQTLVINLATPLAQQACAQYFSTSDTNACVALALDELFDDNAPIGTATCPPACRSLLTTLTPACLDAAHTAYFQSWPSYAKAIPLQLWTGCGVTYQYESSNSTGAAASPAGSASANGTTAVFNPINTTINATSASAAARQNLIGNSVISRILHLANGTVPGANGNVVLNRVNAVLTNASAPVSAPAAAPRAAAVGRRRLLGCKK